MDQYIQYLGTRNVFIISPCGAASSAAGAFAHGYEDGHHSEASPDVSTAVECRALLQWDAARCVNGGYPHGENDVVCFRFHGGT